MNKKNRIVKSNDIINGRSVLFTKGVYDGENGIFTRISGTMGEFKYLCQIYIGGELLSFPSDYFVFTNPEVQRQWEDEDNDFQSSYEEVTYKDVKSIIESIETDLENIMSQYTDTNEYKYKEKYDYFKEQYDILMYLYVGEEFCKQLIKIKYDISLSNLLGRG